MATHVKFLSFAPCTFGNLRPAPNVTETADISAAVAADPTPRIDPTPEALQAKELEIITSYRSYLFWLAGGVVVYRHDPKTEGGGVYAGWPPIGLKETVLLGENWVAEVEFM
jgi:hypothetical protein